MNTRLSKKTFAVLAGALTSFGLASAVYAGGVAQTQVTLQNFTLNNGVGGPVLNGDPVTGDFLVLDASDTALLSEQLNGVGLNSGAAGLPVSPPADFAQICTGPGCVFGQNDYTRHTVPPSGSFARADQRLAGTIISGLGEPTGATADLVSEVQLTTAGQGNANVTSGTGGTFLFKLAKAGGVDIKFDASSWQISQVTPGTSAITGQSLVFDLIDANTQAVIFHWQPGGTVNNATITGGSEISDPFSLTSNTSSTTASNGPHCLQNGAAVAGCIPGAPSFLTFEAVTDALSADVLYQLTFTQSTQASLRVIPEPNSLALLGALVMLFGLGGRIWQRRG